MAVKDGRCYPADGPLAEPFPSDAQNVSVIPRVTVSPYYNEQLYSKNTTQQQYSTVYVQANQKYHTLIANVEHQHFIAFDGIATFNTITVTAKGVTFENITADSFVWHTASDTSSCTNCNNVRLLPLPNKRFFACSGSPQFRGINARVLAPQCKCNFSNGAVTILRDRSSPHQYYTNVSITDLTVRFSLNNLHH